MTAALVPWPTWIVHRDGGTWSGPASCLYDALDRSRDKQPRNVLRAQERQRQVQRAIELRMPSPSGPPDTRSPEERHADAFGTWTPHTGAVLDQLALPDVCASPWSEPVRVSASEVVRVHASGREIAVISAAVQGIDDAVAWFRRAHARALESGRDAQRASQGIAFYASGKNRGQIKWPRKVSPEYRAAFVLYREAVAARDGAEELRTQALAYLRDTVQLLGSVDIDTREHPVEAAPIVRRQAAALDRVAVDEISREVKQARERMRPHVERVDSVQVHSFAPGCVATLLPAKWDDIQEPRRVRVLAVEVDPPRLGSTEPEHRRVVQVLDRSQWQAHESEGQLRPTVDRLTRDA